jgi:hypothetical protein
MAQQSSRPRVTRWLPRRLRGQPRFPMTIVAHGRVHHAHLPDHSQRSLQRFVHTVPDEWGLLFVRDDRDRRWTFYSPDPQYAAMFAPAAHTLELTFDKLTAKFPRWNTGWQIS